MIDQIVHRSLQWPRKCKVSFSNNILSIPLPCIFRAMADKIYSVVIGDVNGSLCEVFGKLTTLHKKQNFAFAIIAGNLFADPATSSDEQNQQVAKLLQGAIEIPLTTYFALGRRSLPSAALDKLESNAGELCPNLIALGRKISIKTSTGFRIVSIGGEHTESSDEPSSLYSSVYSDHDSETVAKGISDADLLITSDWPSEIRDGSKSQYPGKFPTGVPSVASLCTAVKPKYHFSTSESFFEREPFFHNGTSPKCITRFLSLAPFGNTEKQKWVYAFSLEPSALQPPSLPPGCTASPFTNSKKRKLDTQQDSYNSFRYSNGNGGAHHEPDRGRHKRQRNQPPPTPDQCYFCLSNPACETHMIGSIGSEMYSTIAKGPLSTRTTFPSLGFPGHILLIPLQHSPTISSIPEESARVTTVNELQRYRSALQDMLVAKSKGEDGRSKLGSVTWEISRASGVHLHWQFLPVPVDQVQRGLVEAAFDVEAENSSYPKFAKSAAEITEAEEGDYFKVMIWSEALRKDMVLPLDHGFRFDLQFGRRVLGKLLGLEKRTHWRDCGQTKAEEEADALDFKEAFKAFDFSLDE